MNEFNQKQADYLGVSVDGPYKPAHYRIDTEGRKDMIHISKNKCVGCGLCETECPVGAMAVTKGMGNIDQENCTECEQCIDICPQNAIANIEANLRIAIGTDNRESVKADDHVGMSRYFQIWDYSDGNLAFREKRENSKYKENESRAHGDPNKAKATASVISDVNVLIGGMFGPNISRLRNKFVCAVARKASIDNALDMIKENIQEIVEEKDKDESYGIVLH